jgi:hypothetical protein
MMTRYLSGLCVAGLGLCGGGWLLVAVAAFGGERGGGAGRVNLATGAGLIVAGCVSAIAWSVAWRRRLRADGVLAGRFLLVSRREARRNRRQLARDVRRTTKQAKQVARAARRDVRRPGRRTGDVPAAAAFAASNPFDGDLAGPAEAPAATGGGAVNGSRYERPAAAGSGPGHVRVTASGNGAGKPAGAQNGFTANGHDGASAADVLGALRVMLGPLLAAGSPAGAGSPDESGPSPAPPGGPAGTTVPSPRPAPAGPRAEAAASPAPRAAASGRGTAGQADATAAELLLPRRLPRALPRLTQSPPGPVTPADDEELRRIADSEEAWW